MTEQEPTPTRFIDRFVFLCAIVVFALTLLLLVDMVDAATGWQEALSIAVTMLTGGMLLLAINASGVRHRFLVIGRIIVLATLVVAVGTAFVGGLSPVITGFWVLLVVAAPILVLRRVLEHQVVTSETLFGAVSVYLLLAIAGTYVFLFIQTASGNLYFGTKEPTTAFAYFSLVTITTLGYGDLSPVDAVARASAGLLAVTGQVYLVVIVARLVSMYSGVSLRSQRRRTDDGTEAADSGDAA
jgi:hypothetical protein